MSTNRRSTASEDGSTVSLGADAIAITTDPAAAGAQLGRYVVLETVGTGGMGRVVRAYDPKLQREVALKLVRRQSIDDDARDRMLREARAMARLSHPNVVAVYDAEDTPAGVVLVMEYVSGPTLRQWIRERARAWPEVLGVFRQAGAGLAAAHAAGLLHRDFKPGNVLVTASGTAKVTDFGLAKSATSPSQDERPSPSSGDSLDSSLTRPGTVMGTPRYMAPEQHHGGTLGPAVDQYAFCVALWEALCDAPPFVASDHTTLLQAKEQPALVWPASAAAVPRRIVDALHRGLHVDADARWPTMDVLLTELAFDPATRRKRIGIASAALAVVAIAGAGAYAWSAAQARRCSGAAEQIADAWDDTRRAEVRAAIVGTSYAAAVADRVDASLQAYADAWVAMHEAACEATTIRGEQSAAVLDLRMACLQRARVELRAVTGVLANADASVIGKAHELAAGLPPLSRCADVDALAADVEPPTAEEADAIEEARALLAECRAEMQAGHYPAAQAKLEEARQRLAGIEYGPVWTELVLSEGDLFERTGAYDLADEKLQEALRLASTWKQHHEMVVAARQLIWVVGYCKRDGEAGLRYRALAEGLAQGDPHEEDSVASNVAVVLATRGDYKQAEAEFRRALMLREQSQDADDPNLASAHNNLANVLSSMGRHAEAEAEHRRALALREQSLGAEHPEVAGSWNNISIVLYRQGEHTQAEAAARRALAIGEAALGSMHASVADARTNLANALDGQRKHAEAEVEYRAALKVSERVRGASHPHVAGAHNNIANSLFGRGDYAEANVEYRAAVKIMEAALGPEHPDVGMSRLNLADSLRAAGESDEALKEATRAWEINQRDDVPPRRRAKSAFVLAQVLWSSGQRPRAQQLAEEALRSYGDDAAAADVRRWLAAR